MFGAAFAIVAYVFLYGFFDGFGEQLVDNSTALRHRPPADRARRAAARPRAGTGLRDTGARSLRCADQPGIAAAAPRVQAQALVSSATKSVGVVLYGVDPALERGITILHRTFVEGIAAGRAARTATS